MRRSTIVAGATICAGWISVPGWTHPGHGDAFHFIAGGPHAESAAHLLIANPWFAAALLATSALMLAASAWLARKRPRSLKLPRPRHRGTRF